MLDQAAEQFEGEPELTAERAIVLGTLGRGDEGLATLARVSADDDHASLVRARALLLLRSGKGSQGLAEVERAVDHDIDEFIVSVHRLKTLLAARALVAQGLSARTGALVLAGVNRYLHSPARFKQIRRTVHQAMQFVAKDG